MSRYGRIYTSTGINTIYLTQSTHERRVNELHDKLFQEDPDVFVSHKNEDENIAQKVAKTIAKSGLKVYLDIWDQNVDEDGPELVDYIQSVIKCCDSLIAVVSDKTVESWWVPLEVGIAITTDLYLGTYLDSRHYNKSSIPSYLWKWPVLEDGFDLERWCQAQEEYSTDDFYKSLRTDYSYMFSR